MSDEKHNRRLETDMKPGKAISRADHVAMQSKRLGKLRSDRKPQMEIASHFDHFDPERAKRCRDCGSSVAVGETLDGRRFIAPTSRCESRFCPRCASKRARRLRRNYESAILRLVEQGYRLFLLTLTIPNTPTFKRKMLDDLFSAWSKLRRRRFFRGVVATLAVVEVTHSRAAGYNRHLHIILIGDSLPKAEIRKHWHQLTGGEIIDIRNWDSDAASISRILNYLTKPLTADDPESLHQIFEATFRYRLLRVSGKYFRQDYAPRSATTKRLENGANQRKPFRILGVFDLEDQTVDELIRNGNRDCNT